MEVVRLILRSMTGRTHTSSPSRTSSSLANAAAWTGSSSSSPAIRPRVRDRDRRGKAGTYHAGHLPLPPRVAAPPHRLRRSSNGAVHPAVALCPSVAETRRRRRPLIPSSTVRAPSSAVSDAWLRLLSSLQQP